MGLRVFIFLGIIVLAEYYSFILVRSMVKDLSGPLRIGLITTYLLLSALTWLGFVFFRQINWASMPHLVRNI